MTSIDNRLSCIFCSYLRSYISLIRLDFSQGHDRFSSRSLSLSLVLFLQTINVSTRHSQINKVTNTICRFIYRTRLIIIFLNSHILIFRYYQVFSFFYLNRINQILVESDNVCKLCSRIVMRE